jgi:hypothetical protein
MREESAVACFKILILHSAYSTEENLEDACQKIRYTRGEMHWGPPKQVSKCFDSQVGLIYKFRLNTAVHWTVLPYTDIQTDFSPVINDINEITSRKEFLW